MNWIRRFLVFYDERHQADVEENRIAAFLTHVAVNGNVSPAGTTTANRHSSGQYDTQETRQEFANMVVATVPGTLTTRLLQDGYYILPMQQPFGHADVNTTITYGHAFNKGGWGIRSPADRLQVFSLCDRVVIALFRSHKTGNAVAYTVGLFLVGQAHHVV